MRMEMAKWHLQYLWNQMAEFCADYKWGQYLTLQCYLGEMVAKEKELHDFAMQERRWSSQIIFV